MKTIVITGISRGIGLATAKKFLAEGWRVIGTHKATPVPISHENLQVINMDQGKSASIANAVMEMLKNGTQINALVNNAAVDLDATDTEVSMEKLKNTFEVNVFGVVELTEMLVPNMTSDASIVNIDSLYGAFSFPIDAADATGYRMSKAALNMYTRTLAYRLKDTGIIVSSLDPGWVDTDMGNLGASEEAGPDRKPEDVAQDIYILVTQGTQSGYFWEAGKKREW